MQVVSWLPRHCDQSWLRRVPVLAMGSPSPIQRPSVALDELRTGATFTRVRVAVLTPKESGVSSRCTSSCGSSELRVPTVKVMPAGGSPSKPPPRTCAWEPS
jgi:hypothetical protein